MRAELRTRTGARVALRPAAAADEPFLLDLYADRRGSELAPLGWPEAAIRSLLDLQFRAQQQGYGEAFPDADQWIAMEGPVPVGRLVVDRGPERHLVVDMVVLGRCRGRGIGTALMEAVLDDAAVAGVQVRLTASLSDPRLVGWYERLGLHVVERRDLDVRMATGS